MSKYSTIAPTDRGELISHFGKTYEYIKERGVVLDVGCSTGYYSRLLIADKQCVVDGIEIDSDDRAEASKYLRHVFNVNLDNKDWPKKLTDNKYDVIFLGDVIEHVVDASAVLKRLGSMLKAKGVIIISTPNVAHLTIRLELLAGNFEYERTGILDETHLKYFTLGSLSRLITKIGFDIKEIDYSLNDLHPDTVTYQLGLVGLKPNKIFWEQIKNPESRAYQWKMVLKKHDQKSKKPKIMRPPLKPMENNYWFVGQVMSLSKSNNKLAGELVDKNLKLKQANDELRTIRHSIGWRIENVFRKILIKLKSTIR